MKTIYFGMVLYQTVEGKMITKKSELMAFIKKQKSTTAKIEFVDPTTMLAYFEEVFAYQDENPSLFERHISFKKDKVIVKVVPKITKSTSLPKLEVNAKFIFSVEDMRSICYDYLVDNGMEPQYLEDDEIYRGRKKINLVMDTYPNNGGYTYVSGGWRKGYFYELEVILVIIDGLAEVFSYKLNIN